MQKQTNNNLFSNSELFYTQKGYIIYPYCAEPRPLLVETVFLLLLLLAVS